MKENAPLVGKSGIATPVAAAASALLTLLCCLPLGFLGAAGAAAAAVAFAALRPWLLLASAALLAFGFYQLYRGARCGVRAGRLRIILLGLATVIFVLVVAFPQMVSGWLADLP